MRTVFWGTQSTAREALEPVSALSQPAKLVLVGAAAGAAQSVLDNPIEVIKTRLMTAEGGGATGAWVALRSGQFPGFSATLARNVGFAMCLAVGLHLGRREDEGRGAAFARGAVAGLVGSVLTQPLDTAKTRMQVAGGESLSLGAILRSTPLRSLMAGTGPRAALSMCTMGVGATVFGALESLLSQGAGSPLERLGGAGAGRAR